MMKKIARWVVSAGLMAAAVGSGAGMSGATVQPVPGSNENDYVVGPFTVSLGPGFIDDGNLRAHSEIRITNTSSDFTGVARTGVAYFSGPLVLDAYRTPVTRILKPGESQVVRAEMTYQYNRVQDSYVQAQLVDFWYSTGVEIPGTTENLAHSPMAAPS
ncbi:hypothetical protein AB0N05_04700 [Nocardia sp. NPDC051030]|uniref:hypothetical protein n=1 Tax=Nocardia sp. NPDC051030 TaxID=3155162 RepID=UPI0034316B73